MEPGSGTVIFLVCLSNEKMASNGQVSASVLLLEPDTYFSYTGTMIWSNKMKKKKKPAKMKLQEHKEFA